MNREILFRGQDVNGNWVEGDLIHGVRSKKENMYILPIVDNLAKIPNCDPLDGVNVKPETVGQFTGLTDKNGVRIFEGDIVKTTKRIGVCVFYLGCFVIDDLKETTDHDSSSPLLWEVIGNIHDTPNLLTK